MKTIRSMASTGSSTRRLVFMLGIAVALIAGLLAMHTLTAGTTHLESTAAISSAADHDEVTVGAAVEGTAADTGHCVGDCGAPRNMPNHSMLMMVCVLALLAAVIVVRAPALLARLSMPLGRVALVADAPRTSPRPPSLLVLSISRT